MLALSSLLLLSLSGVLLLVFIGCEHVVYGQDPNDFASSDQLCSVLLRLNYDPKMMINGVPVEVGRVDFLIHREGGSTTLDSTGTVITGQPPQLDYSSWPDSIYGGHAITLPQWGNFMLTFGLRQQGLVPTRWRVSCNAFRHADDKDPTFASAAAGGTIEQHVEDLGRVYPFVFTLRSDGKIAEKSVDVLLSFVYDASPSDLTSVIFYIALDAGPEIALTILPPANATPNVLFAGSPVTNVLGNPQTKTGTWRATIQKVPLGSVWAVRCEGYNKNEKPPATPRFTSGSRIIKTVSGDDASYLFDFEVRTGKTEPVPHP